MLLRGPEESSTGAHPNQIVEPSDAARKVIRKGDQDSESDQHVLQQIQSPMPGAGSATAKTPPRSSHRRASEQRTQERLGAVAAAEDLDQTKLILRAVLATAKGLVCVCFFLHTFLCQQKVCASQQRSLDVGSKFFGINWPLKQGEIKG